MGSGGLVFASHETSTKRRLLVLARTENVSVGMLFSVLMAIWWPAGKRWTFQEEIHTVYAWSQPWHLPSGR